MCICVTTSAHFCFSYSFAFVPFHVLCWIEPINRFSIDITLQMVSTRSITMYIYVDGYVHRAWKMTSVLWMWHLFIGNNVITKRKMHIKWKRVHYGLCFMALCSHSTQKRPVNGNCVIAIRISQESRMCKKCIIHRTE